MDILGIVAVIAIFGSLLAAALSGDDSKRQARQRRFVERCLKLSERSEKQG